MKIFYSSILVLSSLLSATAQTTFQKNYPSLYEQEGLDVLPTTDGGYMIAGYTTTNLLDDADILIVKTDALGDTVWTKSYGGPEPEFANSIVKTTDGNYFIIGFSQSFGGGDYDTWLLKVNPMGDTIWTKTYGSWGNEEGREVIPTADGNYVITGFTDSPTPSNYNCFLTKIDPSGNIIWSKNYGGSGYDCGNSVRQCLDGGYIIIGETFSYGAGSCDAWLIKTNSSGDTTWTKTFGGPYRDEGKSIVTNSDGTYTLCVRDSSYGAGDIDVTIIKTTSTGIPIWTKTYGGTLKDTPKMIQPTTDGGYVVACISRSFGWVQPDMWILKLNASGDTLWSRNYGGGDHEHCYSVRQMTDGGYIAIGKTKSYSSRNQTFFLKLNSMGTLGPVAIEEYANESFDPYPNPTEGLININLGEVSSPLELTVFNNLGQSIYSEKIQRGASSLMNLDLKGNPSGMYYMSLRSEKGTETRKVVLR
ncbi:MAG: T9SS type A sorting domain-containing protein [Bacteroidota bacterium]|nr:T9SS type A sorting domain-containing protein [Bacteroidota bacterium]